MENNYEVWKIKGHIVEYYDDIHEYICDGLILPSITQIIGTKFRHKYDGVPKQLLELASERGTMIHKAIELYCKNGYDDSRFHEVRNFKFLEEKYNFKVIDNEVPVILFKDNIPIACGRLDLVLEYEEKYTIADIKTTSVLDKEYLAYQLNLYRIAYQQCYDKRIEALEGVHLRQDVRKFIDIPIKEDMVFKLVDEYLEREEK